MVEPPSTATPTQSGQPAARGLAIAPIRYGIIGGGFRAHGEDIYIVGLVPSLDVAAAYDRLTYADISPLWNPRRPSPTLE